jgi:hypothetical protein
MSEYFYSDDSSEYSSSDNDDYCYCYYCKADLEYDENVLEDLQPSKPRYYCYKCQLHIHTDDLESD